MKTEQNDAKDAKIGIDLATWATKEEAKSLIEKFTSLSQQGKFTSKNCAEIVCDEKIEILRKVDDKESDFESFYKNVKKQLERL
jgi:hypothetical protein